MGQQLGWYITDTRAILNDRLGMFTPRTQLVRWINQGRNQVAKVTGCLEVLVPGNAPIGSVANPGSAIPGGVIPGADPGADAATAFYTIAGVESYAYGYANSFLQQYNDGVNEVFDVKQVAVQWSGNTRIALNWMAWDDFQAYLRAYSNITTSYPSVWSTLGNGQNGKVFLYPPPSTPTEMEWLVSASPLALYSDDDYDAIPDPFTQAVKYYAAHLAYLGSQRWTQADGMEAEFYRQIGIDRPAVDSGKTPTYYFNSF